MERDQILARFSFSMCVNSMKICFSFHCGWAHNSSSSQRYGAKHALYCFLKSSLGRLFRFSKMEIWRALVGDILYSAGKQSS